ncbi:MAG TPA: hypothetical protein VFR32_04570 [Gaiellaceae bacterium]|nr:hypothetical protein [Gaiellaceae bacterium]
MSDAGTTDDPKHLSDLPPLVRAAVVAWILLHAALPFAYVLAPLVAILGWQPAGYVLLAGPFAYLFVTYLAVGSVAELEGTLGDLSRSEERALKVGIGFLSLIFIGACFAATGSELVAVLVVVGLVGHVAAHLTAATMCYRSVMARPWPDVAPIEDDDW